MVLCSLRFLGWFGDFCEFWDVAALQCTLPKRISPKFAWVHWYLLFGQDRGTGPVYYRQCFFWGKGEVATVCDGKEEGGEPQTLFIKVILNKFLTRDKVERSSATFLLRVISGDKAQPSSEYIASNHGPVPTKPHCDSLYVFFPPFLKLELPREAVTLSKT